MTSVYVLLLGSYFLFPHLSIEQSIDSDTQVVTLQVTKAWAGVLLFCTLAFCFVLRHRWRKLQCEIATLRETERSLQQRNSQLQKLVARQATELAAAKGRAESAEQTKSTVLAIISHELRTPLNSILGFTGIVLQGQSGPLNEEQQKQLNLVRTSARHLLALAENLLDISRIKAGLLPFKESAFELRTVLERAVRLVEPLATKKGLVIDWYPSTEIIKVTADKLHLEQVFINLLSNAVKFTEQGSVRVECAEQVDRVGISFIDTGIGIQPEYMNNLFRPFYRLENRQQCKAEGTGLGLFISQRLLTLMGGSIEVESRPGKGSTFTVTLPIKKEAVRYEKPVALLSEIIDRGRQKEAAVESKGWCIDHK